MSGPEIRDVSAFDQWATEVQPLLTSLTSVVELLLGPSGSEPLVALSDQFQAVSSHAVRWVRAHPCPVGNIDGALTRLGEILRGDGRTPQRTSEG
jgi:hypothetical protein